eukprot:TRINITY_DN1375_c0_g1_i3.p1 TRINITY_DN1375_c0_g1~~TRINITY_DN1375_c0_g1_i3.p1  ORF type:complete len:376 (-),score=90.24 TRINITY_DN1375_c0_g1_i3:135-1262(-)
MNYYKVAAIDCCNLALQIEPDLVLFHKSAFIAPFFCQNYQIQCVEYCFAPWILTGCLPNLLTFEDNEVDWDDKETNFGQSFTNLHTAWSQNIGIVNITKDELNLDVTIPTIVDDLYKRKNKIPEIFAWSPSVLPFPDDLISDVYTSCGGYWFLEETDDWTPPLNLVEYIEGGVKPIYIGFGSWAQHMDNVVLFNMLVQVIRNTNQRFVVGCRKPEEFPQQHDSIFFIESCPHSWLFPKMKAVIVHAGAGSLSQGLKAGVPTFAIPVHGDQHMWSNLVERIGCGKFICKSGDVSAQLLSQFLTEESILECVENAEKIGHILRSEDGVAHAVNIVRDTLKRKEQWIDIFIDDAVAPWAGNEFVWDEHKSWCREYLSQ